MRKLISLLLLLTFLAFPVYADEDTAKDITSEAQFYCWGSSDYSPLTDGDETEYFPVGYGGQLVINTETPASGLYVKFYLESTVWDLTVNGKSFDGGENDFLHEYVDIAAIGGEATEIVMDFPRGGNIGEIQLFSAGELPEDVQVWEKPHDRADLVLMSSHSDDEQLFFAGVIPYALDYGADVQVVYFCDHSNNPVRPHEQLDGLWAVGLRNYPVIGVFPDVYSESKEGGVNAFAAEGYGNEDFVEWQVQNIRRFEPQVIIGHDAEGKYGHGTHIINSETLREAVSIAADPAEYPYLTASYGAWDTPKVYLHLWAENEIVMDFDQPLDYYGGMTAYQVSCEGFREHRSQHWTWFYDWMYGPADGRYTSAAQIEDYSPLRYGLWRSTVGADTKADFFENIVLYKQQDEWAASTETTGSSAPETDPVQTEPAPRDDGSFPDWFPIAAAVGGALIVVIVMVTVMVIRNRPEDDPEPTRARAEAERLRQARDVRRASGTAPSRADMQAERLRQARENAVTRTPNPKSASGSAERSRENPKSTSGSMERSRENPKSTSGSAERNRENPKSTSGSAEQKRENPKSTSGSAGQPTRRTVPTAADPEKRAVPKTAPQKRAVPKNEGGVGKTKPTDKTY